MIIPNIILNKTTYYSAKNIISYLNDKFQVLNKLVI